MTNHAPDPRPPSPPGIPASLDLLPEIVYTADSAGKLTYANRVAFDLFGYTEEDFRRGLYAFEMIVPEERERAGRAFLDALGGVKSAEREYTAVTKTGERFPILVSSEALLVDGKPAGLCGVITDLRKSRRLEGALEESNRFIHHLVEATPGILFLFDPAQMRALFLNKGLSRILGHDESDAFVEGVDFLRRVIHPDDFPVLLEHIDFWRRCKGSPPEDRRLDARVRSSAGEERNLTIRARAFDLAPDGSVLRIICSAQDVTDRVKAEAERVRSERRYRAVIDASPMGMHFYRLEPDGRLLFDGANPAADRILGIDHGPLVGRPIEEAFPSLAGGPVPAEYARIAREGGEWLREGVAYRDERFEGTFAIQAFRPSPGAVATLFLDAPAFGGANRRERGLATGGS